MTNDYTVPHTHRDMRAIKIFDNHQLQEDGKFGHHQEKKSQKVTYSKMIMHPCFDEHHNVINHLPWPTHHLISTKPSCEVLEQRVKNRFPSPSSVK